MGLFWDLMQQNEIEEQGEKAKNLEEKVALLEKKLEKTNETLQKTLIALENYLQKDIDGDGKMG
jgi:seryl-tRNA synthetase